MKNTLFIASLFLIHQIAYGMDNETMHIIKTWKDVKPFVGKAVMYHANSSYLLDQKCSYKINPESKLASGFIRQSSFGKWFDEMGYELEQFITIDATASITCLIDSHLSKSNLVMRKASAEERTEMLKAINERKAIFSYMAFNEEFAYKDEILQALEA